MSVYHEGEIFVVYDPEIKGYDTVNCLLKPRSEENLSPHKIVGKIFSPHRTVLHGFRGGHFFKKFSEFFLEKFK